MKNAPYVCLLNRFSFLIMEPKSRPFQLSVNNGRYEFEAMPDAARHLDVVPDGDGAFHILLDNRAVKATLVETDPIHRLFTFRIGGEKYTVKINDHYERLANELGLSVGGIQKVNVVKAPMPGLVLKIVVEAGQRVQKGDPLLILEAMKMENVLKAAGEGVVKIVHAQQGAAVEKGFLLIEME
jgi:biotin carboxyl carrier protein